MSSQTAWYRAPDLVRIVDETVGFVDSAGTEYVVPFTVAHKPLGIGKAITGMIVGVVQE
jgi:hypothetical protein